MCVVPQLAMLEHCPAIDLAYSTALSPAPRPAILMTTPSPAATAIVAEIERRFGFVPPFFGPAIDTPDVLGNLWQQTIAAYIDNPLPALLKEKVSASLSRYCGVSYCLVCHTCSLRPLGMSGRDVLRLLQAPGSTDDETQALIRRLRDDGRTASMPAPGSWEEDAVIALCGTIYLGTAAAISAHEMLREILGAPDHNRLTSLINYVKTCHGWMESHPTVSYELDARYQQHYRPLADDEPGLHRYFQDYLASYGVARRENHGNEATVHARADEAQRTIELLEQRLLAVLDDRRESTTFAQDLVAIVSHDLRTPLNAILMGGTLLMEIDDARATRVAGRIVSSAQRATRMVGDLLDFTQARVGGGIPVRRTALDMHELSRAAVDEMHAAHPDRRIELAHDGDAAGAWDGDRILQVLGNLLGNAIVHSPAGSAVHMTIYGTPDDVVVVIRNDNRDGPIPSELLPVLFDPFKRATSRASTSKSIGLGLYIVKSIVHGHGGEVTVRSNDDGTTFEVRLPRSGA